MTFRAAAKLVRWLGPWASEASAPRDVVRERVAIGELRAYLYRPSDARPFGAYLLAHGLHFLGPDDPRCDRFCRILASAGLLVLAPFLPDHLALRISPRVADDLAAAWEWLEAHPRRHGLPPPALFSISFGSHPATVLAAREGFRDRVGALVLFGGFVDFGASVRFAVTGRAEHEGEVLAVPYDPTNAPVVFLNLLPHLPLAASLDREAVARAWRAMVEATWGRAAMKAPGARDAAAEAIAKDLGAPERELFLTGCGLREGARELFERGLAASGDAFRFIDPRPHLASVKAPVVILHGRADDVIPWFEATKASRALAPGHPHRVLLSGMHTHSGSSLPGPRALAGEVRTMVAIVRAMVDAPRGLL